MSALANYLRAQMQARGWSQTDLAAKAGLPKTTLNAIFNNPDLIPELPTFVKLSTALGVPLRGLLEAAGFAIEGGEESTERQRRLASLVEAMPWLSQIVEQLATLHPDDQVGVLAFLEAVRQQRDQGRKA